MSVAAESHSEKRGQPSNETHEDEDEVEGEGCEQTSK